jgi:RNA 3'-terminal phosphate cyclase (ATP)
MIVEIDGSFGEGGGQIVRTAVALAAVTGASICITNIRQGRPKPGLAPQHAQAIAALALICNAKTEGIEPGSSKIYFEPGDIKGGCYRVDIGTAGSITLLMQCLLPAMINADGPISLEIAGGTDVRWSPTIDYFKNVFLPALSEFGADLEVECSRRGYYPRGGGSVLLRVNPGGLRSAHLLTRGPRLVEGISHCSNLAEHVARRQAESATLVLKDAGYESKIRLEVLKGRSTGSGITLWSGHKGASSLGERGIKAEDVGVAAAEEMLRELASPASVDVHLADQLIPYLALAGGCYTVREVSRHASTNIWTAFQLLGTIIDVKDEGVKRIERFQAN